MKLYTYPYAVRAFKVLIAAEYAGVPVEVAPDFQMGVTNKTPAFLKLNPAGTVPTLELADGTGIFESNAIMRYVARLSDNGLFGASPVQAALVEQWIDFAANEVEGPLNSWVYP